MGLGIASDSTCWGFVCLPCFPPSAGLSMSCHGSVRSSLAAAVPAQQHRTDCSDDGSGNPSLRSPSQQAAHPDADIDADGCAPKRRGTSEAASIGSGTPLPSSSPASLSIMTVDMDSEPVPRLTTPSNAFASSSQHRVRAAQSLPNMHTTSGSVGSNGGAGSDSGETNTNHPNRIYDRGYSRPTPRHHATGDVYARSPTRRPRRTASPVTIDAIVDLPPPPRLNVFQHIGLLFTSDGREQRKRAGILARLAFNLSQVKKQNKPPAKVHWRELF